MLLNLLYILTVVMAIIVIVQFVVNLYQMKGDIIVNPVIAGPITEPHPEFSSSTMSPRLFYHKGKKVNPKDFTVCKIVGDCMRVRGIEPSDIVFVKEFKSLEEKRSVKKGDVVYIKFKKGGFEGFKLREVNRYPDDEDAIETFSYTPEGKIKPSSEPHQLKNLYGVVAMNFGNLTLYP